LRTGMELVDSVLDCTASFRSLSPASLGAIVMVTPRGDVANSARTTCQAEASGQEQTSTSRPNPPSPTPSSSAHRRRE
jgi:hypothetical protein